MATGPKGGWGGKRAGAGGKPHISEREFKGLLGAVKKQAKEKGMTWQEWFAKQMLGPDKDRSARFTKMFMDQLKVRVTESNVNVTHSSGPSVYLPQEKPDPAKLVVMK
jgi:hypothetical protein